jgi:YesN/AraC family two-component response regulator
MALENQPRVLLVDDDADVRKVVQRMLDGMVHLDLAESAERAREKLSAHHYDLALVDVFLPGDDGIALLSEIRRMRPGTRILIFTGRPSEAVTRSVVQGQADDYLEKPFTPDQLRDAVKRLTTPGRPQTRFDDVCNYIRCHLNEDLRLPTVAGRFQMQPSSFSQWFNSEATRRSLASGYKSFIIAARVDRAEQLLATTDMLIKEIAHAVGFSSHQLLNQHFQERHQISPTEWRERQTPAL